MSRLAADQIEYPKDGLCPACGSEVEINPEADYGVAGRKFIGWSCLDEYGSGCDAGQVVQASTWLSGI